MTIINTTFIIDPSLRHDVLAWIKNTYIASAIHSQALEQKTIMTKILSHPEDGSECYALHLCFDSLSQATDWDTRLGEKLRKKITERWGQQALAFHTYMEVIE